MREPEDNGKKVLVTMIGANNAIETEYAFFETFSDDEGKTAYRKMIDDSELSGDIKFGYPFWAKIKSMTNEKCFDQIVFIGTEASKWESLLANAERLTRGLQDQKGDEKKKEVKKEASSGALDQMNQYVCSFLGTGYDLVTDKKLTMIERYMKDLLTPETIKKEKENETVQKHQSYIKEHLSETNLHQYEARLSRSITLAVKSFFDREISPIEVKVILIKEGRTESENRENIIEIQKVLATIPISEITLDVTNGLRSHPMYVLPIINNFSAIRNKGIPVNIYYGMFDAKLIAQGKENENHFIVPVNPRAGQVAPMVDLKEIQTMDRWTRAVSEFFSNGSVLQIIDLLENMRGEYEGKNPQKIAEYITAFETFSLAVNSNNLLIFEEAMKHIDLIKQDIQSNGNVNEIPKYVQICLDQIISHIWDHFRIDDAEEKTKYSFYMFALANWYLQQNRLGDSVRTFQEAVITYLMERYPEKISRLLEKRMIKWLSSKKEVSDVMFDAKMRKVVRDAVFEDDFKIKGREDEYREWKEWTKEYHYMKSYLHDPDALLYNLEEKSDGIISDNAGRDGYDMQSARENIKRFAKKMPGRNKGDDDRFSVVEYSMFEKRIDYLLDIQYYDVFISYRRSYHNDDGNALNDGVLLVTALSDYLKNKGLTVFVDKNKMRGIQGEFTHYLQQNLKNSKLCLVVLGKDSYARDYSEKDEYYKEIKTAVQTDMKIAVICMEDFYTNGKNEVRYGENVTNQKELMKVIHDLQRVGSEYADLWKYENILSLRKCTYKEIKKMLEEE